MDGDRLTLSWSAEDNLGDPSAEKAILWGGLAVLLTSVVGVVVGWFAMAVVPVQSWAVLTLVVLVLGVAVAVPLSLTRTGSRRRRRNALLAVGAFAVFVLWIAATVLGHVRPTAVQLRRSMDSVRMPAGFELVSETASGDRFCQPRCVQLERLYRAPAPVEQGDQAVVKAMLRQGWTTPNPNIPEEALTQLIKGDAGADIYQTGDPRTVRILVVAASELKG